MRIEFFNISTRQKCNDACLFVMDDMVYQDNFQTCESQSSVVGFEDFIRERRDLDWRVVE